MCIRDRIRIALFAGTVVTVKYIFSSINHDGDEKIKKMKELINFTEYLRVYSCDMKMSIEEICLKYNFKSIETEVIITSLFDYIAEYIVNIINLSLIHILMIKDVLGIVVIVFILSSFGGSIITVSYTHLDVYKRQQ